jgi:hypothetical protein
MDIKFGALLRNQTWHLVPPKQGQMLLTANGCIRSKGSLTTALTDIRHGW